MVQGAGVEVRIRLTDLGAVHWPDQPIVGGGDGTALVAVPVPGLAWTRRTPVRVPLGTGVAERIATVARLQKVYELVVIPAVLLLLVLGLVFLMLDWSDTVGEGGSIGAVLWLVAFVLIVANYGPLLVASVTKTPRIVGGELRLPAAHEDVAREAVALNPSGTVRIHSK